MNHLIHSSVDALIFDLDGTLWDTCPSVARAWNTVVERNKISAQRISADQVRSVAGKPHDLCIREVFSDQEEEALQILIRETEIEDAKAIRDHGGVLYPGVVKGLKRLAQSFPLFIVSNCQSGYIELFYELTGLNPLFKDQECWGNTKEPKAKNIASIIRRNRLKSPIYIGDTQGDMDAAKVNKIPFFHMTYGFADVEAAEKRFDQFDDFVDSILKSCAR